MKKILNKKYPGQIMVIVLVLISVLSIIALSATLTSVRDTQEKTQNNQYQAYYAVGEQKLLDFQQKLKREALPNGNPYTLDGDTGSISGQCVLDAPNSKSTCSFDGISTDQYNTTGTIEKLKTVMTVIDSNTFTDFPAKKDKDLLIDLAGAASGTQITLTWAGGAGVAWNFTVDTLIGANYGSEKSIYNSGGPYSSTVTSYTGTCYDYSSSGGNSITLTLKDSIPCPLASKLFFRVRPITSAESVNMNLSISGNTKPLQRTIKSITTTADTGGSGQTNNPTAVLETKYSLIAQPFSLFDYVLRTESDVVKN